MKTIEMNKKSAEKTRYILTKLLVFHLIIALECQI